MSREADTAKIKDIISECIEDIEQMNKSEIKVKINL